ncbi:NADPH-dependent FMN reductase [Halopelagius longus]|uniref:NAD(P)H-dependent FMN reductase n=1 Tax=Halopelagius longus TaxID=1236180 RepID=A0A1H1EBN0_9EURY|nr:NAD(P)H-dependent oxidoreductase [Halopelagius longus]RDI71669.1 NADPH-dependent oxidoreductase [Halopelagius longus]SDQ85566.1 NAD(P)H-dependent FMN reductase [Halopelagius longus]
MTKVIAVCGSRRDGSHTLNALRVVLEAAREAGAETEMIDLGEVDLPLFHPDKDEQGDSARLTRTVREADGVVLGSPVYHGSYSSTFRNFHDYCNFDDYEDTAVGLVAVAGGGSYGATLEHMRSTVRGVHGYVVPQQVGIRKGYEKFESGELVDEDIEERLVSLGKAVFEHAAKLNCEPPVLAESD